MLSYKGIGALLVAWVACTHTTVNWTVHVLYSRHACGHFGPAPFGLVLVSPPCIALPPFFRSLTLVSFNTCWPAPTHLILHPWSMDTRIGARTSISKLALGHWDLTCLRSCSEWSPAVNNQPASHSHPSPTTHPTTPLSTTFPLLLFSLHFLIYPSGGWRPSNWKFRGSGACWLVLAETHWVSLCNVTLAMVHACCIASVIRLH